MSVWLLLHVHAIPDILEFVDVLFQGGVLQICIFLRWSFPFYVFAGAGGGNWGACFVYLQPCLYQPRKMFRGTEKNGVKDVWDFRRSPSRLLSSMVERMLLLLFLHKLAYSCP